MKHAPGHPDTLEGRAVRRIALVAGGPRELVTYG